MLNQYPKKTYFQTFLKNDKDNNDAIGDYSMETEYFSYKNVSSKKLLISKLTILIEDNAKLRSIFYGADTTLTNGLQIYYTNKDDKEYIVGDVEPIYTNKDWLKYQCNIEQTSFSDRQKFLKITFNFRKDDDCFIILNKNEEFTIELNDNFNKIDSQTFNINGFFAKI